MVLAYPAQFKELGKPASAAYLTVCNFPCQETYLEENKLIPMPVRIQYVISSFNLAVQVISIVFILMKGFLKKGPFFRILFLFSIIIASRIIFYTICMFIAMRRPVSPSDRSIPIDPSIYLDYFSNLFSITITFFMSLNRCLSFISKPWNSVLFEGCNLIGVVILSVIASVLGAVGIIRTSEVTRQYFFGFGFLDVGPDNIGYKVIINRSFNLFPIGSVICYIVLYHYFYKRNRERTTKTIFIKRGEQQVFSQLLVTAALYLLINIIYETITLIKWNADEPLLLFCLEALAIANYLPEMTLPLFVIAGGVQFKKFFKNFVVSKEIKEVANITRSV